MLCEVTTSANCRWRRNYLCKGSTALISFTNLMLQSFNPGWKSFFWFPRETFYVFYILHPVI